MCIRDSFGNAFVLNLLITLKVIAWSLLFVIPGIVAAYRYSMATYIMAENPGMQATEAIERSKSQDLSRLLFAFGIRQVGQKAGKVLAARFRTLEALQSATLEELTGVDDIGAVTAQSLLDWFASPQSQHLIARLREAGVNMEAEEQGGDQRLSLIHI